MIQPGSRVRLSSKYTHKSVDGTVVRRAGASISRGRVLWIVLWDHSGEETPVGEVVLEVLSAVDLLGEVVS